MVRIAASWPQYKKVLQQRLTDGFDQLGKLTMGHPLLGGGIVVSLIFVLVCWLTYAWNLSPVNIRSKEHQIVEIHYGASVREIGRLLEQKGIIRSARAYELYMRLQPVPQMSKAGRYILAPSMSVDRIVDELEKGTSQDIQVTIPEGFTNLEIAELLAAKGIVDKESFLAELGDSRLMMEILGDLDSDGTAEGYLYPDTYRFSVEATETQIIETMAKRFREVYQENLSKVPKNGLREVLIIASIVEKEAKKAAERPIIAGVFYNRLHRGYRLQSCATVQYALGFHKERLYYQDLQVNSPYNTYRHNGLPPGPIANPGLSSLLAAAHPRRVSYLYFVAKADGSHIFSDTYEQHLQVQRSTGNLYTE